MSERECVQLWIFIQLRVSSICIEDRELPIVFVSVAFTL